MTEKLMTDLYRIGVPLPNNPLRELNCYFLRGRDRSLLIDTGFHLPECRAALDAGLAELGVRMEETDILLTHMHSDHSGLAPDIASPETRVYVSAVDRPWLVARERPPLDDAMTARFTASGIAVESIERINATHPGRRFAPDPEFDAYTPLADGDVVEVGGRALKLILTPGHTPGNSCLWLEEEGVLFSGDHVLFDITPNITFWSGMEDSLGSYLENLEKIRRYPVKKTFPGHRKTGDFHARVDELLVHHRTRLAECLRVVRENPGSVPFEIAGKMSWRIRSRSWEDFPMAQKWFAVGECISHLDHLRAQGAVTREDGPDGLEHYFAC